jgi:NAD(P)-dependent dehydrogenase (short-subunit alcohol dehydrogenase family)
MNFSGKRAVVTGAASGLGRAIASELATRDARVLMSDVNEAALMQAAAAIGRDCPTFRCDISNHAEVEAMARYAREALGGCDIVFANAGVMIAGPFTALTPAEVDWVLGVNVRGAWSTGACFTRLMEAQQTGGSICFTASEHALGFQHAGAAIYTASKHAVLGLAEVLRAEAPPSIRVSVFCPGLVSTALGTAPRPEGLPKTQRNEEAARMVQARGMAAEEAAAQALDGVARGDFYIVTHPHAIRAAERRFAEIEAAFAAQAPWTEDAERYDVNRVIADVMAELRARRG